LQIAKDGQLMKKNEVPRDNENLFEGKFEEIQYATDESGKYISVKSSGWNPKNIILKEEWKAIDEEAEEARLKVLAGEKSPLYFHMKVNQMSRKLLANYAGMWACKVKRLCKPKAFEKIKHKDLEKLAYALKVDKESLQQVPDKPVNSLGAITNTDE
jgi:PHD/YefM family antitoxin component YafN of YafNO toxin-antitoxin module